MQLLTKESKLKVGKIALNKCGLCKIVKMQIMCDM